MLEIFIKMIKLTNILNELNINNPNITAEKVYKYCINNIRSNDNEFRGDSEGWPEYKQLCIPYCEKYEIGKGDIGENWIGSLIEFQKLSQFDLNRLYREMRALVRKYVGKEIL